MIVLLGVALTCGAVLIHYEGLRVVWAILRSFHTAPRRKLLIVICGVLSVHWLEIGLFSVGYFLGDQVLHLGIFETPHVDPHVMTRADYIAFSAETYTSLGLGDIRPIGTLRLLAGTETLTGLILIAWSASFTYLAMSRFWRADNGSGPG